jgi:hypothetical protein
MTLSALIIGALTVDFGQRILLITIVVSCRKKSSAWMTVWNLS